MAYFMCKIEIQQVVYKLNLVLKEIHEDTWTTIQTTVGLGNLQTAPTLRLIRQKEQICNLLVVRAQPECTSTLKVSKCAHSYGIAVSSTDYQKNA